MKKREFLDIFSSKKIKEKEKISVTVDYREKNSLVVAELIKEELEVNFKSLDVADYIVKDVAIERKTVFDFISSMINRRLMRQLQEIQQYDKKLLIIEGIDESELYSEEFSGGMHPNSIRGFLLSILLKYNVPIIFSKNSSDTAKFISLIAKKQKKEASLNVSKRFLNKKEQKQFILESFPGIGPKNAKKLLEKFGTLKGIINADDEELKKVLGKRSEEIKELIEEEY